MKHAIVLGAGAAGVCAALQLQARGWSVVLVDRTGVGLETSYGNAGILQREAVEPYAMPRDLKSLLAIATGSSNDVHYNLKSLPPHMGALARYWWNSSPTRHARISAAYSQLIAAGTHEHRSLIENASAEALVRREGFRVMQRDARAMVEAIADAERLRQHYGVAYRALSPEELRAAEPGLATGAHGAIHWLDSWTVSDPGALMKAYGERFVADGGTVSIGEAASLRPQGGGWRVDTSDGAVDAEHAVVALGPWSAALLRPFGYRFPMVLKRGYHRHYRVPQSLDLPLMDAAHGYVMAPMAKGLRITTGAELAGTDAGPTPVQLERAERAARDLIGLGAPVENQPWLGTRPCMPDMLPVIGAAPRHKGLWLHFGHGHQGLTLGAASGRLLAEMMCGETPFTDATPFRPGRY